jgi:hypothetical protein
MLPTDSLNHEAWRPRSNAAGTEIDLAAAKARIIFWVSCHMNRPTSASHAPRGRFSLAGKT